MEDFLNGYTSAQTKSLCYKHIERYSIRNGITKSGLTQPLAGEVLNLASGVWEVSRYQKKA